MPEHTTLLYDRSDHPISAVIEYEIEPGEPGFYSFTDGWVEPPLGPNVIFNSILGPDGEDLSYILTNRDYERIEYEILHPEKNR